MANYDNTDKGVLFIEENKKGDTHPDFKGSVNVNYPSQMCKFLAVRVFDDWFAKANALGGGKELPAPAF